MVVSFSTNLNQHETGGMNHIFDNRKTVLDFIYICYTNFIASLNRTKWPAQLLSYTHMPTKAEYISTSRSRYSPSAEIPVRLTGTRQYYSHRHSATLSNHLSCVTMQDNLGYTVEPLLRDHSDERPAHFQDHF